MLKQVQKLILLIIIGFLKMVLFVIMIQHYMMNFLVNHQNLNIIKDKKFICFAGSVPQAKELGGDGAVHSSNKKNDEIIQAFNEGETKSIYAVNMLKEGINLSDIEASLIIQLSSKELDIVQRTGRILRAKEQPEQYIIYYKNTQDEKYLGNVLKLFDVEELVL